MCLIFSSIKRYMRKRPKVDASIFNSALSHTRRSDASEKKEKIACPLFDVLSFGQVSSPRLYRLERKIPRNIYFTYFKFSKCSILNKLDFISSSRIQIGIVEASV